MQRLLLSFLFLFLLTGCGKSSSLIEERSPTPSEVVPVEETASSSEEEEVPFVEGHEGAIMEGVYDDRMYDGTPSEETTMESTSIDEDLDAVSHVPDTKVAIRTVTVDAKRWEFSPTVITAKAGETIKIVVNNLDTTHNMVIPDLGVSSSSEIVLPNLKKGEYPFTCADFCSKDHPEMAGIVRVE